MTVERGARHVAATSLRGIGRMYILWPILIVLMFLPYPWRSELGKAYTYWVLSILGIGVLVIGALMIHSLASIRRAYREARDVEHAD